MWLFLIQESSSSFFIAWWLASPEQMRGATGLVKARHCLLLVKVSHAVSPHSRGGDLDSTSWWVEWHGHTGREGTGEGCLWSLFTMLSPGTPRYLEDKKMRSFQQRMWRSDPESKRRTSSGHFSLHLTPFPICRNYYLFPPLLSYMDQTKARSSVLGGRSVGPGEKWWGMKSFNCLSGDFFSVFHLKHWKMSQVPQNKIIK